MPSSDKKFSGFAGMAELYGVNAEKARLINAYVPGDEYSAKTYPAGHAVRIPPQTDIVFELHYTPNNREPTFDQSMVGFRWAKGPPAQEVLTYVFRKPIGRFRIPPHVHHFKMQDTFYFSPRCRDSTPSCHTSTFAANPIAWRELSGTRIAMKSLNERRFSPFPCGILTGNALSNSTSLCRSRRGTELVATAHYDNSSLNPNNPDPDQSGALGPADD